MTAWEPISIRPSRSAPPDPVARLVEDARARTDALLAARDDERVPAFAASDGPLAWNVLTRIREDGLASGPRFVEWGSGLGVMTGLAALAGFEARGIEIGPSLVAASRDLLRAHGIEARIEEGTYAPPGAFADEMTLETFPPAEADVIYAYPWPAEEAVVSRVFLRYAPPEALLVTFHGGADLRVRRAT
jgi:hypothetical protein